MFRRRPVASCALLVYLVTAGVAALGGQSHEPEHKTPAAPARPAAAKPPDMSAIVERIQKRIDDEVVKPAAARAATTPRKPPARPAEQKASVPPDRRIRLLWRVSLIWPQELVDAH